MKTQIFEKEKKKEESVKDHSLWPSVDFHDNTLLYE